MQPRVTLTFRMVAPAACLLAGTLGCATPRTEDAPRLAGDASIDLRRTIRFNFALADLVFFVRTIPAILIFYPRRLDR